jgi:ABC-type multidrug transport system fused ATPase/permease subunit
MNIFAFVHLARQAIGLVGARTSLILIVVAIFLSVFDLVGIAVVYPFIRFIYLDDKSRYLPVVLPDFIRDSSLRLNLIALVLFFLLFVAKTLAQYLLIKVQATKLANASLKMTERFMSAMLNARFSVFQMRSASEAAHICYSYPGHAGVVVLSLSQLLTEAVFFIVVASVALVADWRITLTFGILLLIFMLLLLALTLRPIQRLGEALRSLENRRHRLFFEIASSVREIGVMGLAAVFKQRSDAISQDVASVVGRSGVLATVPRLSIELLFMFCVLSMIVFFISLNYSSDQVVPLMGLILVGAIRMVPAVSRTLTALSNAKFSSGFVRDLIETRALLERENRPAIPDDLHFAREINLRNVEFRYGDRAVLNNVNLTLPRGAYVSIVGRSGEGKSTLLDILIGLQEAYAGTFTCDGEEFDPFSSRSYRNLIGYVPQSVSLFDDSLAFNISLQDSPDLDHLDRVLVAANLKEFAMDLPQGIRTSLGENGIRVSGGQRQRIGIARALFRSPEILVLDEATSSLDGVTEANLTEEIQKLRGQLTILLVAHRLSTVKMSDCIYVLSGGQIVEKGTHKELLALEGMYSSLAESTLDTPSEEQIAV